MPMRNTIAGAATLRLALALAVLAGLVAPAVAQDQRVPTTEEIIRRLAPALQPSTDPLRSDAIAVEGRRPRAAATPAGSMDFSVNFEYASARLTPDARILLDNLGRALVDPALRDSKFRVEGHTDARGGDAYNLTLSRQRAQSVANYLKQQHRIGAQRLSIEGFGKRRLLDPANPESAVNRRVQITNLGS